MPTTFTCENCGSLSYEQFSQTQVRCIQCKNIYEFDTGYTVPKQFETIIEPSIVEHIEKSMLRQASIFKRFINYMVDMMVILFIFNFFGNINDLKNALLGNANHNYVIQIFVLIFVLYYFLLEYFFSKTLGKFLTRTKVVSKDESKVSVLQCLGRVISRFLPFEYLSFIIGGVLGIDSKINSFSDYLTTITKKTTFWHDSFPQTLVIED